MQRFPATERSEAARRLFERELNPGETILWSRKATRMRDYASVAYIVVFMCVWAGLPTISVGLRGSLSDWLFLGPFVSTGILFAIFMTGRQLSKYVAVTNRRVFAGSGFLFFGM